jgi:hypothetical protein
MMSDDANAQKVPSAKYQRLAERFPAADHKRVNKGGRDQAYIPWTDKVERFNDVLGQDWSFRVVREGMTNTEAWVLGELSVTIDGVTTVRQQYGCEAIVKGQRETPTTDLFKIAGTDALSKAATLFGCGLYLSIQEERAEVEAEMRRPKAPATANTSNAGTTAPSTTAGVPADSGPVRDSAAVTGADPLQQRWARLVAEATWVKLPTLGTIKAIDPKAAGPNQLQRHCERLEARLYELKDQQGAA